MADLMKTEISTLPRTSNDSVYETNDGGFNRRVGLGLVLSVGANVLLLQGAGMMKNHMDVTPRADKPIVVKFVEKPTPSPAPTATPSPTPTPEAKKPDATPTPVPTPRPVSTPAPTPTPETPKPTPTPEAVKPIPKPVPSVKPTVVPDKTPTPTIATPTTMTTQASESAPSAAAETAPATHESAPRSSKQPALANPTAGSPKLLSATTPREESPAANTNFVVDAANAAPTQHVADLPHPTLAGQISAAIKSAASGKVQDSDSPTVASSVGGRAPGTLRAIGIRTPGISGNNPSLIARTGVGSPGVSLSNGGQMVSAGGPPHQGSGSRSAGTATITAAGPTALVGGTGGQTIADSGPGGHNGSGPAGFGRHGKMRGGDPVGPGGPGGPGTPNGRGDGGQGAGFGDGLADGNGKHPGFATSTRPGGPAEGFGGNGKSGDLKGNGNGPDVKEGTPAEKPAGPMHSSGGVSNDRDGGSGSAVNAVYKDPATSSITVPEALRSTPYDVTVTVRVVLQASGQIRVEITSPSGYSALDAEVKAVCEGIRFKAAMQDGKAVDETHTFNFHLHNGS